MINSWDGSDVLRKRGPDGWSFAVDGQSQLSTTFSNQPLPSPGAANNVQSFGGHGAPAGNYPAFTGAAEVNTLGYKFYRGSYQRLESMDSVYRFTYTVPHAGDSVRFDFRGFGLQGLSDESWGLDNVRVTADSVTTVIAVADAAEGGSPGSFLFTRTGDTGIAGTAVFAMAGSATDGDDYTLSGATLDPDTGLYTLTFSPGSASAIVTITPVDDAMLEGGESVEIRQYSASGFPLISGAFLVIADNAAGGLKGEFAEVKSRGLESITAAKAKVVLSEKVPAGQTVTVQYSVTGGTANGGAVDFTLADGTLTFNAGDIAKEIAIAVVNDEVQELFETIQLTLANPNGAALGAKTVHTYTIVDDEWGLIKTKTAAGANYAKSHT